MQPKVIHHCFTTFKDTSPLVHNITNDVANNTVANVLLAAGASPAMVHDIKEAPEFVTLAQALSINIGTLTQTTLQSMLATAEVAHSQNIPWILDPVAVGATSFRQQACTELLKFKPDVIRGNASEILALAGMRSRTKGTDSGDSVDRAIEAAQQLTQYAKVVVVTGAIDWVTDGTQGYAVDHGHPMMTQVTAIGCALTALIGGFIGANTSKTEEANSDSLLNAATTALAYYAQAGEIAAQQAKGPGSFYVHFLDALYNLEAQTLIDNLRVTSS